MKVESLRSIFLCTTCCDVRKLSHVSLNFMCQPLQKEGLRERKFEIKLSIIGKYGNYTLVILCLLIGQMRIG